MRTIIIGDIHGCDQKLNALLDKVHSGAEDRLILLGDLFDRDMESWEVYQSVLKPDESYPDTLFTCPPSKTQKCPAALL